MVYATSRLVPLMRLAMIDFPFQRQPCSKFGQRNARRLRSLLVRSTNVSALLHDKVFQFACVVINVQHSQDGIKKALNDGTRKQSDMLSIVAICHVICTAQEFHIQDPGLSDARASDTRLCAGS